MKKELCNLHYSGIAEMASSSTEQMLHAAQMDLVATISAELVEFELDHYTHVHYVSICKDIRH